MKSRMQGKGSKDDECWSLLILLVLGCLLPISLSYDTSECFIFLADIATTGFVLAWLQQCQLTTCDKTGVIVLVFQQLEM